MFDTKKSWLIFLCFVRKDDEVSRFVSLGVKQWNTSSASDSSLQYWSKTTDRSVINHWFMSELLLSLREAALKQLHICSTWSVQSISLCLHWNLHVWWTCFYSNHRQEHVYLMWQKKKRCYQPWTTHITIKQVSCLCSSRCLFLTASFLHCSHGDKLCRKRVCILTEVRWTNLRETRRCDVKSLSDILIINS